MPNDMLYRIRKVRLINFHNFVDETIVVNHGGHLFLLGDNGSGKTTLLDAIHLVLTANEEVEFNAAARVAGSSRDGRRLQGIIMRQNIETSAPLNPHGGITYAAVEIESRQGKPLTLAMGLRAQALDDQVQYWGVIRPCSLDELPLYREYAGERYAMSRRELRDAVDGNGFYPDLKSYREELIRRLYGNADLFKESCRLLRMGKAYREIAAGTSDYHELFKKLLPDPQRELFERVIRTLRELDQSNNDLAGLEEKQRYLESLGTVVASIDRLREAALRYQWLIHHLTRERLDIELVSCQQQQANEHAALTQCRGEISAMEVMLEDLQRRLHVLQQTDASGLLNLQRERTSEEERFRRECTEQQAAVKGREQEQAAAARRSREVEQQWQSTLKRSYDALHRLRHDLPFSISALLGELDALQRLEDIREARQLDIDTIVSETQRAKDTVVAELTEHQRSLTTWREMLAGIENDITDLTTQEEVAPKVEGFRKAEQALRRQMIDAIPLYRALEWKPGLSAAARAAIEEAIGPEVLATLLISAQDYVTATGDIFPGHPCIRLANREEAQQDPPAWIKESFDIEKSDPRALYVLAEEMMARADHHPVAQQQHGVPVLRFRGHERRLQGTQPSLIGAESRREAVRQQLKALHEQKKATEREIRDAEKQLEALTARKHTLEALDRELRNAPVTINNARHALLSAVDQRVEADRRLTAQQAASSEAIKRWQDCKAQLVDLQARINREGLDKLEDKQRKVTRDIVEQQRHRDELHKREGVIDERIAGHRRQAAFLEAQVERETACLQQVETGLAPFATEVESVAYYVQRTWRGQQFTGVENVQTEWERVRREEAEAIGGLRRDLNHPTYGALYAFTYDEPTNHLVDRYMSPIAEVVIAGQRQIDEQREIINERTQELIRNIIMGDLFTELKGSVSRLRSMVKKINSLLDRRIFGSNGYRFRLEGERHYRDLLEVIEKYNPLDPAAQDELKHFLEIHKDEIMATEVNDIPAALDYRNWFLYELAMVSETDDGEVVMNRKTKSLGSGGEQAVPNYLLILTVAHFLYDGNTDLRHRVLLFDEAFYGIDAGRRDQLLGFASDLQLQLFVASPDLDGVKQEIPCSTTLLVVKDDACDVHLFPCDFTNPRQLSLLDGAPDLAAAEFGTEIGSGHV